MKIDEDEGVLLASFDGREVEYAFGELDTLIPAYATTIHKSQGSEYPAVVITLAMQHYNMLGAIFSTLRSPEASNSSSLWGSVARS